ncbi:MAG: polysaccharide deacetylase family protein [Verrucomicrobiaceae bacterium]|nr:polysaccharide deacetylase family protein [Verrucomicrobiaceae bacterium]
MTKYVRDPVQPRRAVPTAEPAVLKLPFWGLSATIAAAFRNDAALTLMARRLILWFNVIAPVAAILLLQQGRPWWWAVLCVMAAHSVWLFATLVPSCSWWGPVMLRLPTTEKKVWITIDDGPHPQDTPALLALLAAHRAKAAFFIIGERAERYPQLVRDILDGGHEVGDHTYHHPAHWFWFLGRGGMYREITKGAGILRRIAPELKLRWFRAPAGMRNHHAHPVLDEAGLRLVGWSVRGRDGVVQDKSRIVTRLKRGIRPGAIILMHEGRADLSGERLAPQVLGELLEFLKSEGYEAVLP